MSERIPNMHLLLLTAYYLRRIRGRLRFQKIVFLLKEKYNFPFTYSFIPYLHGPYCAQLQNEINILSKTDYLMVIRTDELYAYEITPLGEKIARQLEKEYGTREATRLRERLEKLNELETEELVTWSKQVLNEKMKNNIFA